MKYKIIPICILIFHSCGLLAYGNINNNDTVTFTSEKIGLFILTQNIDSIKYYPGANKLLWPLSPSNESFSANISTLDTTKLIINLKDISENNIVTFIWKSILPGAYRFYWWQYINNLPSGTYYIEKIVNYIPETYKAIYVR